MQRIVLALAALALLLLPGAASASCTDADLVPSADNLERIASATLCLHNEERAANDLAPLSWSDKLASAARAHSDDMVLRRFFDHTNLDGLSPFLRIEAAGYRYTWAGENIAWGAGGDRPTPASIMSSWMGSPGHRENILRPQFRHIGIGIAPAAPTLLSFSSSAATYTANFGDTLDEVVDDPPAGQTPAPVAVPQTKLQACLKKAKQAARKQKRKKLRKRCKSRHGTQRRR